MCSYPNRTTGLQADLRSPSLIELSVQPALCFHIKEQTHTPDRQILTLCLYSLINVMISAVLEPGATRGPDVGEGPDNRWLRSRDKTATLLPTFPHPVTWKNCSVGGQAAARPQNKSSFQPFPTDMQWTTSQQRRPLFVFPLSHSDRRRDRGSEQRTAALT